MAFLNRKRNSIAETYESKISCKLQASAFCRCYHRQIVIAQEEGKKNNRNPYAWPPSPKGEGLRVRSYQRSYDKRKLNRRMLYSLKHKNKPNSYGMGLNNKFSLLSVLSRQEFGRQKIIVSLSLSKADSTG